MVVSKRAEDRKDEIVLQLRRRNRVYVSDLSSQFAVSEVTIRKDLQELERRGLARRVHGGAMNIVSTAVEPTLSELEETNIEIKRVIAEEAFRHIDDNDAVFLYSSTTTRELIPFICQHPEKRLTIITSSVLTAAELANLEHITLIMIGGSIRSSMYTVEGPQAINFVGEFHADKTFIGTNGFDTVGGVTITNVNESLLKRAMIANSSQTFLIADSSKYNCIALSRVCPMERIDFLITDDKFAAEDIAAMERQGVEVIIAHGGE